MTERPTVLVVEDERDLADLYTDWLEEEYDVLTAYSADGALDYFGSDVDVVLLDRRLPKSSGDDVLIEIRESDVDCQIAMVTAVEPDFDILEMGFNSYVVKPLTKRDLHDLVHRLLTRGLYNAEVRRYFSLLSKRTRLETTKSPVELESNEQYQELLDEIDDIEERLDHVVGSLEYEDFVAVIRSLNVE
ncbi:MAG: HalX domain-containing protein [Halodesulfurarchaeum sp.]